MSTRLETAYISARLADSDRIHALRDRLFNSLPLGEDKYTRRDAHLTIIPSFQVPRERFHEINRVLTDIDLTGKPITVHGLGVYPDIRNPRVVLLDVHADLAQARERLMDVLNQVGATNITPPVPPHITLFKCDNGYVVEDWQREKLQECIVNNRNKWSTEIKYVDLIHTSHD